MTTESLYENLTKLLTDVSPNQKQAFESVGGGEPGGQGATGSDTQHASKSVDNSLNPVAAKPGAFAQKLTTEVKAQGPGAIDSAPDADPIKAEEIQADVGLKQTTVGRDPAQEGNYVGTQDEPGVGTATNAKFDDGKKYATVAEHMSKSAADRRAYMTNLANEILSDIATDVTAPAAPAAPATPKSAAATPQASVDTAAEIDAMQAGYALAAALGMEKYSAEQRAQVTLRDTMLEADYDATLVHAWLHKCAADDADTDDVDAAKADAAGPVQDAPASGAAAPADMPAGGAAGDVPMPAPAAGGGDPVEDAMQQLTGGEAAPAPGADAGMGGAPVSKEEMLQGLLMAMQELGITPDEVAAAASAGNPAQQQAGQKIASETKKYQRAGKFKFEPVNNKRAREITDRAKGMLLEFVPQN